MEEKTLFEIPIYSMSEKEFDKRWNKKRDQLFEEFIAHGHTPESAKQGVSNCLYPRWLWKYNQIVGYIIISVTDSDVLFGIHCSMDERYYADSKQKHFIEDWACVGTHFYAAEKTDAYIKQEIRVWLKSIETDHLHGKFHVDYSTFNNIFDFVDIKRIIDTL